MFKLWRLKQYLRRLDNPCLWLSGGSDSLLLLHVLLTLHKPFSILRFEHGWTREQRKVVDDLIMKHDLRVYTYTPTWALLMGNDTGDLAFVAGYPVSSDGQTSALLCDVVQGSRCAFDVEVKTAEFTTPPVRFATHIVGTKKGENHWVLDGQDVIKTKRWEVGDVDFVAPLFSWNDQEVIKGLRSFDIEWQKPSDELDTGNISVCTNCLHGINDVHCPKTGTSIKAFDWSPQGNLLAYQQQIGIV